MTNRVIGLMRVKNEARWIEKCVRSLLRACPDGVYIFDDHSTDGTPEICAAIEDVSVIHSRFDGLNEARDKNVLLEHVRKWDPWVIMIDGDEMFTDDGADHARNEIVRHFDNRKMLAMGFPILYLWDRPDQVRVDGLYARYQRLSAFRLGDAAFPVQPGCVNFHCGNVPEGVRTGGRVYLADAPLLHFGYMHAEDRIRKYHWYNKMDPGNRVEDGYRHVVIGDLFPADSRFKYAGPLALKSLNQTA